MQDKFLSAAYRRTKEMDGLLNQLFYLSALETGSLPMYFQAVELKEFLQTYMKMRQAKCDDVVFCLDLPRQAFVRIDCQQMERVLDNVIENSKKYSGKSKVQISNGLKACFDCCYVSIADGGILWLLLIGIFLIQPRTRFLGIVMFVCIVTDLLLCNGLLKNVFERIRPCQVIHNVKLLIPQPSGASFPSGHTSISFVAVGALYYSHAKKYATYCFIPASLIAISRLYLFVHYPTDILGGIFVGILSSYLGIRLVHYIENWRLKNLKNVALTS